MPLEIKAKYTKFTSFTKDNISNLTEILNYLW